MTIENNDDFEIIDRFILNGSNCFFINRYFGTAKSKLINIIEPPDLDTFLEYDEDEDSELIPIRKIGVCGSFGVGKHDFAESLALDLELPLVEDVSNTVYSIGFNLNNLNSQIMIMFGQLYEQLQAEQFVADGTLVDVLANLYYLQEKRDLGLDSFLATAMFNFIQFFLDFEYTAMFYIPISKPCRGKKLMEKQREIDRILLALLDLLGIRYIPIVGNDMEKLVTAKKYLMQLGMV